MARPNPERSIRSTTPLPAIRVGALQEKRGLANRVFLLKIVMRILAVLWIGEGLFQWASVLMDPTGSVLGDASLQQVSAVVFFSILDLIAAVGLWLATPWGGAVWLVTVGGQLLSVALLPGFWTHPVLVVVRDCVLVAGYLTIAWLANQEIERQR